MEILAHKVLRFLVSRVMLAWELSVVLAMAAEVCSWWNYYSCASLGQASVAAPDPDSGFSLSSGATSSPETCLKKAFLSKTLGSFCLCYMDPETDLKGKL